MTPEWTAAQDRLANRAVSVALSAPCEAGERLRRAGIDEGYAGGVAGLRDVPVLNKDDLPALQGAEPPFGGMLGVPLRELRRIHRSPGPINDPEGVGRDYWGMAPAFVAAGFRPGDVVLNTFSYHLTPGGHMMDAGLREAGCVVVSGGVGNTLEQAAFAANVGAVGYVGTPQFLLALLEKGKAAGIASTFRRALVSGAPLPPPLREELEHGHGLDVYQAYGTADVGAIGYECVRKRGWNIAPRVVVEILDPGTREPCPPRVAGEVVVTVANPVYPLVRFGTGDLSAFEVGDSGGRRDADEARGGARSVRLDELRRAGFAIMDEARGGARTPVRLVGFLGRTGEGVKVRGMFVHPRQLAQALGGVEGVARYQAQVTADGHRDVLTVVVEPGPGTAPKSLDGGVLAERLREAVKLRAEVRDVPAGTLPEDAAPLVDLRTPDP